MPSALNDASNEFARERERENEGGKAKLHGRADERKRGRQCMVAVVRLSDCCCFHKYPLPLPRAKPDKVIISYSEKYDDGL